MRQLASALILRAVTWVATSLTVQVTIALSLLAFLPILVLGWVALRSIATASRATASDAYTVAANATATTLTAYIDTAARDLIGLRDTLTLPFDTAIEPTLRGFVVDHPSFRRVTIVAGDTVLSTSAIVDRPEKLKPRVAAAQVGEVRLTSITSDEDFLPSAELVVPVDAASTMLVADIRLEYVWRVVHALALPSQAHAMLADQHGRVFADSDPARYDAVARGLDLGAHPLLRAGTSRPTVYAGQGGVETLAVTTTLPGLNWILVVEQPTLVIDGPALNARRQLLAVLIAASVGVALMLVLVGRTLTKPLQTLTDATHRLARGEDVPSVPIPRHPQLAALAHAFNALVDARTALRSTVRRQERDVVVGQVAGGLLHDLAHPITNIVNNARLLPRLSADAGRDSLRLIEREYGLVEELFDHLREFAKSTDLRITPVAVPLSQVIADVASLLRADAAARGVELRAVVPTDLPPVLGDRTALTRVLRNLTLNAIEAAHSTRGLVTVSAEVEDRSICVIVEDTGPGLSSEALERLFDPWRSTKRRGLGLGLATAKRVVEEQMGGTLTASSVPGAFTRCVVRLPRPEGAGEGEARSPERSASMTRA